MINIILGRFIKTGNITQLWMFITCQISVVGKYLSTACRKCYFRLWYVLGRITIEIVSNKNHCKTLKSMFYKTVGIVWEGNLSLCQFIMYPPHILNILYNRQGKKKSMNDFFSILFRCVSSLPETNYALWNRSHENQVQNKSSVHTSLQKGVNICWLILTINVDFCRISNKIHGYFWKLLAWTLMMHKLSWIERDICVLEFWQRYIQLIHTAFQFFSPSFLTCPPPPPPPKKVLCAAVIPSCVLKALPGLFSNRDKIGLYQMRFYWSGPGEIAEAVWGDWL